MTPSFLDKDMEFVVDYQQATTHRKVLKQSAVIGQATTCRQHVGLSVSKAQRLTNSTVATGHHDRNEHSHGAPDRITAASDQIAHVPCLRDREPGYEEGGEDPIWQSDAVPTPRPRSPDSARPIASCRLHGLDGWFHGSDHRHEVGGVEPGQRLERDGIADQGRHSRLRPCTGFHGPLRSNCAWSIHRRLSYISKPWGGGPRGL